MNFTCLLTYDLILGLKTWGIDILPCAGDAFDISNENFNKF